MEWQQLIDESVDQRLEDAAFPEPDLAARVAAGRSALRRRRTTVAALAGAAVVVAGGLTWVAPRGWDRGADPVGPPTHTPTHTPSTPAVSDDGLPPVRYGRDGELVVRDGWQVVERIDDPVSTRLRDGRRVVDSVGVDVQRGTEHRWLLVLEVPVRGGTEGASASPEDMAATDFATWVDLEVALRTPTWSRELVVPGASGPAPGEGVAILDQQLAPELGPMVWVAAVEIAGEPCWIVARPASGGLEARVFKFRPYADPSEFIAYVGDLDELDSTR